MYISEDEYKNYAELILHLVAVDTGDIVLINSGYDHKNLVSQLVALSYKKGAKYVHVGIQSEYLEGLRADHANIDTLDFVPDSIINAYKEYNDVKACVISIRSPEDPDIMKHIEAEKISRIHQARRKALSFFHDSIISDKLSWIVVACPAAGWAKNIFPELPEKAGVEKLWGVLKPILRLDTDNPIKAWEDQQQTILRRRAYMDNKKFNFLNFKSEGTDFTVYLNEKSKWLGAAHTSVNGKYFQANLPTEELYSSPDCRFTEGLVKVKRPLPIFGKRVEGITMRFEKGRLVEATAEVGNDVLQQFIKADERNRYLGEIALVDTDTPIGKSKIVFNSILYDENAGVHFALGSAYTSGYGYAAGEVESPETLIEIGCNSSNFHLDFVIGDYDMNIVGGYNNGTTEAIMVDGTFIKELR